MEKHNILIVGAGKIGITVATLLAQSQDYNVYLGDLTAPHNMPVIKVNPIKFNQINIKKIDEVSGFIKQQKIQSIVSCLPFHLTLDVAMVAQACDTNYFDLTEDVAMTEAVNQIALKSKGTFAPQCGLAPGFISIAANSLIDSFEDIEHVKMRVGALSQTTNNSLHYAFTWSIDGVVNEYIHPCIVVEDGQKKLTPALGGLETIIIGEATYEAFHTSGGAGSLVDTYKDKVKNMDYKTIRYQGHCNKMKFILQDLKLNKKPELIKEILNDVIPHSEDDKVIVYVAVEGRKNGQIHEKTYANTLYPLEIDGYTFTAIQLTTATSLCTTIDMVVNEKKLSGLIKQEQITLTEFLANRFGNYYAYKRGELI